MSEIKKVRWRCEAIKFEFELEKISEDSTAQFTEGKEPLLRVCLGKN